MEVKLYAYMYFFFSNLTYSFFVAFMLQGGLRVSVFLRAPPALPPSVSNLGWPTNPISQALFAYCVNSFTTAAVPRWPCLMLFCSALNCLQLFCLWSEGGGNPFRILRMWETFERSSPNSCQQELLLCFISEWVGGFLHTKNTIKLRFVVSFFWLRLRSRWLLIFATVYVFYSL